MDTLDEVLNEYFFWKDLPDNQKWDGYDYEIIAPEDLDDKPILTVRLICEDGRVLTARLAIVAEEGR